MATILRVESMEASLGLVLPIYATMPAVLYGPGNIFNAHSVDELVNLDEVMAATRVLALVLTRWCGGEFA